MVLGTSPARDVLLAGSKAITFANWGDGIWAADAFTYAKSFGGYHYDYILGPDQDWGTSATIGNVAGFLVDYAFTARNRNPTLTFSFHLDIVDTATNYFFMGFCPPYGGNTSFFLSYNGPDPLNGWNGVGIALHQGNYKVATNDGADETTFHDFAEPFVAVAEEGLTATVQGREDNDGFDVTLSAYIPDSRTQTLQLTSNTPDTTYGLGAGGFIMTNVAASNWFALHRFEGLF